jgi:hypothetical protein
MNSKRWATFLLSHSFLSVAAVAQDFSEHSIPEPTLISVVASDATAKTAVVGIPNQIESDDSLAEVAVVEVVTSDDNKQTGIRILLEHDDQHDFLYLDSSQLGQFRDELASFASAYERGETCEAINRCMLGVARCRPSQTVRQAFCPSFYSTPDGKQGLTVSTPRHSFSFPSIEPSVFLGAIDAAIGDLKLRKAGQVHADEL